MGSVAQFTCYQYCLTEACNTLARGYHLAGHRSVTCVPDIKLRLLKVATETTPSMNKERAYSYQAYGLSIQATLPLPELVAGKEASVADKRDADIVVRFGKVEGSLAEANDAYRHIHATPEGIYLSWRGVGAFLVRDGREIIVDPAQGVEERVLRLFILGTTLAMLLHQRGELVVLHASVVAISGQAVAFVGVKHAGKSTMAAALYAQGHDLVADDILAIDMSQDCPMALPGFPHLKIWPDSVASLGYVPETLPRLRPELEKRGHRVTGGFSREPVPLRCIHVLGLGLDPEIEPLRPQEALLELMPHWYGARFGTELLQAFDLSTHFLQCANLANKVPVCRLKRPPSLSALPDVIRLVEEHLASDLQQVTV